MTKRLRVPKWLWRLYVNKRHRAQLLPDNGEVFKLTRRTALVIWHYPVTVALYELPAYRMFWCWESKLYLPDAQYIALGKGVAP